MGEEERKRETAKKTLTIVLPLGVIGLIMTGVGLYLIWDWYLGYMGSFELSITSGLTVGGITTAIGLLLLVVCISIMQGRFKTMHAKS